MKKILLMITLVLGLNVLAHAQTKAHRTPEQRAERLTKMLSSKLNLSADQSTKVKAIFLARATQLQSIKADTGDRKAHRAQVKDVLANTDKELSAVFNTSQKEEYTKLKADLKSKFGKRGHFGKGDVARNGKRFHKNPEQRAERMAGMLQKKLNLSANQSAKVKAIFLSRAAHVDSLRSAQPADKKFDRSAFKETRQKTEKEISAVLTADQQKAYEQLKAQMKERHKNRKEAAVPAEVK
jgi:Spy/CpxP family protein refolding chaperone